MGVFDRILAFQPDRHPSQPDRRDARRVAVAMTGLLSGSGCDEEVVVANLSGGGAMIETRLPLRVGERFDLSIDGWGSVPVVVRWAGDGRAGLEFQR